MQPELESVYLTSREFSSIVSNPFWVDPTSIQVDHDAPLRKHVLAASALTASISITSLLLYGQQRRQWFNAQEAVDSIALPHESTTEIDFKAISTFTRADESGALKGLRPEFLADAQADIAAQASRDVLMQHLLRICRSASL